MLDELGPLIEAELPINSLAGERLDIGGYLTEEHIILQPCGQDLDNAVPIHLINQKMLESSL